MSVDKVICSEDNVGCNHFCREKADGFTCYCRTGFNLDSDAKTCIGQSFTIICFSTPIYEGMVHFQLQQLY